MDVAAASRDVLNLIGAVRSIGKPVVVVGTEDARRAVLNEAAAETGSAVVALGSELATILLSATDRRTDIAAAIAQMSISSATLILDRIQILMLPQLDIDVIDTLTRVARRRSIAVSWPGRLEHGRLRYADHNHPECLDIDAARTVVYDLSSSQGISA